MYSRILLLILVTFAPLTAQTPTTSSQNVEAIGDKPTSQIIEKRPVRTVNTQEPIRVEQEEPTPSQKTEFILETKRPSLLLQALAISMMALLPFSIMLLSPYLKFVVVLSMLRTALGVQNSPPNMIINGVAIMMSVFILYPTLGEMYDAALPVMEQIQTPDSVISANTPGYIIAVTGAMQEPVKNFLQHNSSVRHQRLFYRMIYKGVPEKFREGLDPQSFIILVPSYITGQLKEAFEIGVLIYIPFFVIDLVVSNILLAMGMMMLSPVTISMPLKLFLLVMLDGWTILIEGLVETFR